MKFFEKGNKNSIILSLVIALVIVIGTFGGLVLAGTITPVGSNQQNDIQTEQPSTTTQPNTTANQVVQVAIEGYDVERGILEIDLTRDCNLDGVKVVISDGTNSKEFTHMGKYWDDEIKVDASSFCKHGTAYSVSIQGLKDAQDGQIAAITGQFTYYAPASQNGNSTTQGSNQNSAPQGNNNQGNSTQGSNQNNSNQNTQGNSQNSNNQGSNQNSAPQGNNNQGSSQKPQNNNQSSNYIGADKAKQIALAKVPGATITDFEMDRDGGRVKYEGELRKDGTEYDFKIDAVTGEILSWKVEKDDDYDDRYDDDRYDDDRQPNGCDDDCRNGRHEIDCPNYTGGCTVECRGDRHDDDCPNYVPNGYDDDDDDDRYDD